MTSKLTRKKITRMGKSLNEEAAKLKDAYLKAMNDLHTVNNPSLILICILSAALVIYFSSSLFNFVGLVIFGYTLYALADRQGHKEGYIDGHYGMAEHKPADPKASAGDSA